MHQQARRTTATSIIEATLVVVLNQRENMRPAGGGLAPAEDFLYVVDGSSTNMGLEYLPLLDMRLNLPFHLYGYSIWRKDDVMFTGYCASRRVHTIES
jgi:hypothetical protein